MLIHNALNKQVEDKTLRFEGLTQQRNSNEISDDKEEHDPYGGESGST